MKHRKTTNVRLGKGSLVAARFAGGNWDVDDVGVVLDTREAGGGAWHVTLITHRGVLISMGQHEADLMFRALPDNADGMFLRMYALMSRWQAEEDHESGLFTDAYAKARALVVAESAIQMASLLSAMDVRRRPA